MCRSGSFIESTRFSSFCKSAIIVDGVDDDDYGDAASAARRVVSISANLEFPVESTTMANGGAELLCCSVQPCFASFGACPKRGPYSYAVQSRAKDRR